MGYTMTMSEAKSLKDSNCSVRLSLASGGIHGAGRHCAELVFSPTGAVIATEYDDGSEENAFKKALGNLSKAPNADGSPSQQTVAENEALKARVAALEEQLSGNTNKSKDKPSKHIEPTDGAELERGVTKDEFDGLKASQPSPPSEDPMIASAKRKGRPKKEQAPSPQ